MIRIARVYGQPGPKDGCRVLVDRLWPRGVKKGEAKLDKWMKEIGPSDSLRKWFAHKPERWLEFQRRYCAELKGKAELLRKLRRTEKEHGTVTLLFAAKDEEHNQAVVLRDLLRKKS